MHKPKKIYDQDGEYLTVGEQDETKAYSKAIYAVIAKSVEKVKGKTVPKWISGAAIRREVGGDVARWEAAIALLVEDIEVSDDVNIPKYRLHKMRSLNIKRGFSISQPSDKIRPHAAVVFGEEYAKAI